MSFFQNPFVEDFEGNWLLGDRQYVPKFVIKGNKGRGQEVVVSWSDGPYNLSGNDTDGDARDTLKIAFSLHGNKNWATISVDVTATASSAAAVTPAEIVSALNEDTLFSERFTASLGSYDDSETPRIKITQRKPITEFKFYIINGQAEEALKFNARAGIGEAPVYFSRHTLANRFSFTDSQGMLIELDTGNNVDSALINNAVDYKGVSLGYSSSTVQEDWQLLGGRSGIFNFRKIAVDGSDRITEIIEYPAGARVGDLARKTLYSYTSSNKNPDESIEIPYTLTGSDLITP